MVSLVFAEFLLDYISKQKVAGNLRIIPYIHAQNDTRPVVD